ncbi:unnamed protein product [Somion occarium]|uniref:Glucose-methanol-choline oxidoreductase N-terminal domain-containing protein n=1 Tax=Somion occarium TaxID=3059160 RepID=A0ABP1DFQ4_9APHY
MPLLSNPEDVIGRRFDFIIAGGGTAGLVLANRLSENPDVSVIVLEAGNAHVDDPIILSPTGWVPQLFNSEYEWGLQSTPQPHSLDQRLFEFRGKGLGGSSSINCLVYLKPHRADIDAFEKLGNPGWNWENYQKYSKKAESVHAPVPPVRQFRPTYNHDDVGHDGPLPVSFCPIASGVEYPLQKGLSELGIETISTGFGGETAGTYKALASLHPVKMTRTDSANAYLFPVIDRPNLQVLTGALVTKVVTSGDEATGLTADAVEFEHGGKFYQVLCAKDVILSAGAIKSPQILELSGIGDRSILEPLGIETKLDLPTIGTNTQDHFTCTGPAYELRDGNDIITGELIADPDFRGNLKDPYKEIEGPLPLVMSGYAFFPLHKAAANAQELIDKISAKINDEASPYSAGLREVYHVQLELLKDEDVPDVEIMVVPFSVIPMGPAGRAYVNVPPVLSRPFSRGTVHINSADPLAPPVIDPHIFEEDIDMEIITAGFKVSRAAAQFSPYKDIIAREVKPGPDVVTDDQIKEHIKSHVGTVWHMVGSCSMLPRDKGGVVDAKLKVYGTNNIRVVDLSILPILVSTHPQATVYAVAEQGDIIKADHM